MSVQREGLQIGIRDSRNARIMAQFHLLDAAQADAAEARDSGTHVIGQIAVLGGCGGSRRYQQSPAQHPPQELNP